MSPANETVECTLGDDRVGEEGVPVFGCPVGGDYQGAGVVAPVDKLIEVFSLSLGKLPHCEVIHYQVIVFDSDSPFFTLIW